MNLLEYTKKTPKRRLEEEGLLSEDIVEDLRTCRMDLNKVCKAIENPTEQFLAQIGMSPAEIKVCVNAINTIKKSVEIISLPINANSNEVQKVVEKFYISVFDVETNTIKMVYSDDNRLLKRLLTLSNQLLPDAMSSPNTLM